jgi:hypothetical protein
MRANARRLIRGCWVLVVLAGIGGCSGSTSKSDPERKENTPDPRKEAELKWAREVAENFLNDIVAGKWDNAAAVTSRNYTTKFGTGFNAVLGEMDGSLEGHKKGQELTGWTISSQQIAPDLDETSFRGELKGHNRAGEFTLRVVKQKDNHKWRVEQFSFRPQPQKK